MALAGASLPAVVAAAPAGDVGAAEAVPHPDAELIAACAQYTRLNAAFLAVFDGPEDDTAEQSHCREAAGEAISARMKPLVDRITSLRATTLDGMRARAGTLASLGLEALEDDFIAGGCHDGRMLQALLRDLHPGRAWGPDHRPIPTVAAPAGDSELLAACADFHAANAACLECNATDDPSDDEISAVCAGFSETLERIMPLRPRTAVGLRAKAAAAHAAMLSVAGPSFGREEWTAFAVLADLLALPYPTEVAEA